MKDESFITVIIVDDHDVVREGIKNYLETQKDIKVIGEAAAGAEALRVIRKLHPRIVLLDLKMPEMEGVEVCKEIKTMSPESEVIILTSYHDDHDIFPALEAGALSYLLKDVKAEELVKAVRAAANGESVLHHSVTARMIESYREDGTTEISVYRILTKREIEILSLISKGMSNRDISEALYISIGTVKGHVSSILDKLQLSDRTQAAVYAWKNGLAKQEY